VGKAAGDLFRWSVPHDTKIPVRTNEAIVPYPEAAKGNF
jgi:hypothetical protein